MISKGNVVHQGVIEISDQFRFEGDPSWGLDGVVDCLFLLLDDRDARS